MKTRLISMIAFLIFPLTGCEKDKSNNDDYSDASSISFTGCITDTKSTDTNIPSIRLIGQAGGKLTVKMVNTEFCCGTDSVSIDKTVDENNLSIEIIDNGPFTYCFCPHDMEFSIANLDNKAYDLTLIESEHSYSRDTFLVHFEYSQELDTIIDHDTGSDNNSQINYVKTILGGCNNQDFEDLKSATLDYTDTVDFTIIGEDTLDVFVGMNYICCAPFISETDIMNDTLIMTLSDTCSFPYQSCYCRCMCYYTWDFQFTGFKEKEYKFIVKLNDPREENTIIFKQGVIDLSK